MIDPPKYKITQVTYRKRAGGKIRTAYCIHYRYINDGGFYSYMPMQPYYKTFEAAQKGMNKRIRKTDYYNANKPFTEYKETRP